jgi:glycosyltransferase involved in cell wall biosynthesis
LGTLNREIALYKELFQLGWEIHIFTFDKQSYILNFPSETENFVFHSCFVLALPSQLTFLNALLVPLVFWRTGKQMGVVKTNQSHNGWHAWWASFVWQKPLIARSGFVYGEQWSNRKAQRKTIKQVIRCLLERMVMRTACLSIVPTDDLAQWCQKHYKCEHRRLVVLPNNIDVNMFKPAISCCNNSNPVIIAVGRLSAEKRLDMLIKACRMSRFTCEIMLVGEGEEAKNLSLLAEKINQKVKFLGVVSNDKVVDLLQKADLYVICSQYEGHPKALAEAMACGCACVGTDSPGIRNQITDQVDGIICQSDITSLSNALNLCLTEGNVRQRLGSAARKHAVEQFSLKNLAFKENTILRNVVAGDASLIRGAV